MAPRLPEDKMSSSFPDGQPATDPAALPQVTTAAMERFQCLADKCEDTCCRDWAVPISRADIDNMKTAMSSSAEGRERLVKLVVIGRPPAAATGLAQIHLDDKGACPMLNSDNRCGVHGTFGEAALTTTCSVFPRTALAVEDKLEVGGSLACPEVARLTLLADENPRLRPAGKPMLPRPFVGRTVDTASADGYGHHFVAVRDVLLACFQTTLPLGTRFILAADLADRLRPFFHAGTAAFQGARRTFGERRLAAELAQTASADLHTALDNDLATLSTSGEAIAAFAASLLVDRRRLPHSPRFAALLDDVFASLRDQARATRPDGDVDAADDVGAPSAAELARSQQHRRAACDERWGGRSTAVLARFAQHYLLRNPFTTAATLLDYLYGLGVHLAAIRLLIVGHPTLAARLAALPDAALDQAAFDQVAVHVVQTFTKAISHHPAFIEATIARSGGAAGTVGFGRLALIAKFL